MKKYETIKRIDLMDRQSLHLKSTRNTHSRLNSLSRSSQKSLTRDHTEGEALTDRNRRINQFNVDGGYVRTNIKTYVRVKPITRQDIMNDHAEEVHSIDIKSDTKISLDASNYTFDGVFSPEVGQQKVYQESARELVKNFVNGYNATIFAYGQTGSGKTYTMFGEGSASQGIIPRVIDDIFLEISAQLASKDVTISCSMFEIYKQCIYDLMNDKAKDIKIKENSNGNVQLENLTLKEVTQRQELLEWINKGSQIRSTRSTEMNDRSSRSHLVFTLYLTTRLSINETRESKLNLVDLAGSEKVSKTKVEGEGLDEAIKINLSLSCLGNTIYALSRGQQHVPFRDSKLTRVLQQSLSGNSITRVIVTCSMLPSCREETISSIKFANRIKKLKTSGSQNIKKNNETSVNKFMYQTLKTSYQNCEQKLDRIKGIIENYHVYASKEEVIEAIRQAYASADKIGSENQFLECFRSPTKPEGHSFSLQSMCSNLKSDQRLPCLAEDDLKNLEAVVLNQQQIIKAQAEQIEMLKKSAEQSRNENQGKNLSSRLKIMKTNHSVAGSLTSKNQRDDKKLISLFKKNPRENKQNLGDFSYQRSIEGFAHFTHKQKVQEIKYRAQKSTWLEGIVQEFIDARRSYNYMQKSILNKQIVLMSSQIKRLRKIVSTIKGENQCPQITLQSIEEAHSRVLAEEAGEKDKYIKKLQEMMCNRINFHHEYLKFNRISKDLIESQKANKLKASNTESLTRTNSSNILA